MHNLKLTSIILVCFALVQSAFAQHSSVLEVRSALRYKFALDFALHLDSLWEANDSSDWQFFHEHSGIRIEKSSHSNALEQFACYGSQYSLYRIFSFTNKTQYFVLAESSEDSSGLTLYLFSKDSVHPSYLDKYDVGTTQPTTFRFDTINGGEIIRINAQSTGTGLYARSLILIAIRHDSFVNIFHCDLSYLDATTDTTYRGIGTLKFVDLDNDGFLDIVYKLTVDVLAPDDYIDVWIPGELKKAKALYRSSQLIEHYIWNRKHAVFERQK